MTMLVKSILASLYSKAKLTDILLKYLSDKKYLLLMYHRVIPFKEAKSVLQAGMYVEPDTFEMQIYYLKKYFNIVPFNKLASLLRGTFHTKGDKPICVLTFDDGWYDFYKFAYPVLKAQNVPATVFLPTKYIGTEGWFWTDQMAYLLAEWHNRNKELSPDKINIESGEDIKKLEEISGTIDIKIEKAISLLKKYNYHEINKILKILKERWDVEDFSIGRAFLRWEEVGEMLESGVIHFGSHTHNHSMLTLLTDREIMEELILSKEKLLLEKAVENDFIPFCYPNGNYNGKVENMVKASGYHAATTTENGWNAGNNSMFRLHRIAVHQDMTSSKELFGSRVCNLI
jgi:peptidoglycan/xylan/chitin deacetylase (PgdA/CDA1 family)